MHKAFTTEILSGTATLDSLNAVANRLEAEAAQEIDRNLYSAGLILIGLGYPEGTQVRATAEAALAELIAEPEQ